MHELVNAVSRLQVDGDRGGAGDKAAADRAAVHEALKTAVQVLSPIAPHICQSLWSLLGEPQLLVGASWPAVDESALVQDSIELVVQVNGKVRGRVELPVGVTEDAAREAALGNENVERFVGGKTVRKFIMVPGKLINIVVGG